MFLLFTRLFQNNRILYSSSSNDTSTASSRRKVSRQPVRGNQAKRPNRSRKTPAAATKPTATESSPPAETRSCANDNVVDLDDDDDDVCEIIPFVQPTLSLSVDKPSRGNAGTNVTSSASRSSAAPKDSVGMAPTSANPSPMTVLKNRMGVFSFTPITGTGFILY